MPQLGVCTTVYGGAGLAGAIEANSATLDHALAPSFALSPACVFVSALDWKP